jgi:hypothetical protein
VRSQWAERHRQAEQERERLVTLEEQAKTSELSSEEAAERCVLTEDVSGGEAALPLWEELLRRRPNDAPTAFAVGRLRLGQGDTTGLEVLEQAMEADDQAILPACEVAFNFLIGEGRGREAEAYERRARERIDVLSARQEELEISSTDNFVQPDISEEIVDLLRERLAKNQDVGQAYLVQKRLPAAEFSPCILVVVPEDPIRGDLLQRLADAVELPVELQVVLVGAGDPVRRRVAAVPGAKIYER